MNEMNTLGERLKMLIKQKGMEQQEVAARLGINPVTFSGYVINKREPSFDKLKLFADYFGVSIDFLLGYSDISDPYLKHLPDELSIFVREPENTGYIELAKDIKNRTDNIESSKKAAKP